MGSLTGCGRCLKYAMFTFNFIFLLCGLALLGLGIWVAVDDDASTKLKGSGLDVSGFITEAATYKIAGYVLIAVGSVIVIIAFMGCCGAVKEFRCMLITFFILMLIVLLALIAAAVLAFAFTEALQTPIKASMTNSLIHEYGEKDKNETTRLWDNMQTKYKCCAVTDKAAIEQYRVTNWYNKTRSAAREKVPKSCCKQGSASCIPYENGCFDEVWRVLLQSFDEQRIPLFAVGIATLVLIVIGMVIAMALTCMIERKDYAV
ncbi:tetraspanin-9 [Lingula anatina]|uniref:Tetraspanin n=1 Tax=Lingula anatina TaxID=7574 RepID=A0A1S3K405_LINAN|nr:tetraspanin-9 [Lingula anatina]|eukprot:XP_013417144.1 tetraspanin-9 [Lingula anatina]